MTDWRQQLVEGRVDPRRVGEVVATGLSHPPYTLLDACGNEVEPVGAYLRDLALSDVSILTCRSYGLDLLRWFRVLWLLGLAWDRAAAGDVQVLVGWMRSARNPQRDRGAASTSQPGTVNPHTGKAYLQAGYAPLGYGRIVIGEAHMCGFSDEFEAFA